MLSRFDDEPDAPNELRIDVAILFMGSGPSDHHAARLLLMDASGKLAGFFRQPRWRDRA